MMKRLEVMVLLSALLSVSLVSFSFADTGCRRDCEPPTLGVLYTGEKVVDKGFTINDKSFDVAERSQTVPTTVARTGENTNIKLIVYENGGTNFLRNVSVSIGTFNNDFDKTLVATMSFKQPFTAVLRQSLSAGSDVTQMTSTDDPTGLLKDVTITSAPVDQFRTAISMSFKLVRPIDTSDIIVQTLDGQGETGYNVLYKAIKSAGKDLTEKPAPPTKIPPISPLKQLKHKVPVHKIECRDGYEKVTRNNGAVACVSTYTAELLRSMKQVS